MSTNPDQPRSDPPTSAVPPRPFLSPLRLVAALCVVVPFVAVLWIPSYNKKNPELLGFPFFYWYQLLWVVITAVLMVVAFQATKRDEAQRRASRYAGRSGGQPGGEAS